MRGTRKIGLNTLEERSWDGMEKIKVKRKYHKVIKNKNL
jgi:hypothetical protein